MLLEQVKHLKLEKVQGLCIIFMHGGITKGPNMITTETLWQEIEPIYQQILSHPFIEQKKNGTLPTDKFCYYLKQDYCYLSQFSRALAITGAKIKSNNRARRFFQFALRALEENHLHQYYAKKYHFEFDCHPSPSCLAYTNFLMASAYQSSYLESLAALLPCFWIYRQVGKYLCEKSVKENPFIEWIQIYAGEEFDQITQLAIGTVEEALADASTKYDEKLIKQQFRLASYYEWKFWDSAYRMESWNCEYKVE